MNENAGGAPPSTSALVCREDGWKSAGKAVKPQKVLCKAWQGSEFNRTDLFPALITFCQIFWVLDKVVSLYIKHRSGCDFGLRHGIFVIHTSFISHLARKSHFHTQQFWYLSLSAQTLISSTTLKMISNDQQQFNLREMDEQESLWLSSVALGPVLSVLWREQG